MRRLVYLTRTLGILIIVMVITNILFTNDENIEKVEQSKYNNEDNKENSEKKEKQKENDNKRDVDEKNLKNTDEKKLYERKDNTSIQKNNNEKQIDKKDIKKRKEEKTNDRGNVSVNIEGGIQSEEIANKLKRAGVISDSESFNKFMISHGYDSNMRTGTFLFKKNMKYNDIRNVLIKEEYR